MMVYSCPRCGRANEIVNQCGCDPDNLPTRVPCRLVIRSLRDLTAECSCGRWTMSKPTFDRDTDEEIKTAANEQHAAHVARGRRPAI